MKSNSPVIIESPDYEELLLLAINDQYRDIESSIEYSDLIDKKREEAKQLVKSGEACKCDVTWIVAGSKSKGKKSTNDLIKLAVMTFDTLCDRAYTYVRYGNKDKWQHKIIDAYNKINRLYSIQEIRLTDKYLKIKLEELDINFKYQQLRQEEKEKSKEIKRKALEEKREKERLEAEQLKLEQELARQNEEQKRIETYNNNIQAEITKTQEALSKLEEKSAEAEQLHKQIQELEAKLQQKNLGTQEIDIVEQIAEIEAKKEVLQAGFVYVISNYGAFGENIFKIGVTRRVDPLERINELGNASVPFKFNVHAIIPSDTAFGLEYEIHKRLRRYRVNLVNCRKEFFKIDMDTLISILGEMVENLEFNRDISEEQYNETIKIRNNQDLFDEWLKNLDERYDSDIEEEKQLRALGIQNINILDSNSKYQIIDEYNELFNRVTSDISNTSSTPVMRVTKYYMAIYMQLNDKMKKLCTFYKSGDGKRLVSFSIEGYKGEETKGTRNSIKIQDLNNTAIDMIINKAIDIDNILVDACDIIGI